MDGEFKFQPVERREVRRFEPPPWEKEVSSADTEIEAHDAVGEGMPSEETTEAADVESEAGAGVEGRRVEEMLAQLKAQEPSENENLWKVNLTAALTIAVVGLLCSIWGTAAIARSGGGVMATVTALVLLLTGLGFLGAGVKIGHRTLRQRGVL